MAVAVMTITSTPSVAMGCIYAKNVIHHKDAQQMPMKLAVKVLSKKCFFLNCLSKMSSVLEFSKHLLETIFLECICSTNYSRLQGHFFTEGFSLGSPKNPLTH